MPKYSGLKVYPAEAKRSFWDKNKAFTDKVKNKTRKTGLGPLLDKAKEEYEDIDFTKLEAPYGTSEQQLVKAKAVAVAHYNTFVKPAITAMKSAGQQALDNTNDTDLTDKSRKAAAKITVALRDRWRKLEAIKPDDEFDEAITALKNRK